MNKWKKLGQLFDPTQFDLPQGCKHFAQAPQALVFDNFVRIYFSTRTIDSTNGKFLSHICFVDFDRELRRKIRISDHSVIELGKLGCFDEHGIFPMNVIRNGDLVFGYTSGVNRRVSVPADGAIGLAVSRDNGYSFQRIGDGPVLAPSLHEPCLVVDPFVKIYRNVFHMWYVFGVGWNAAGNSQPDRVYKIGHAVSENGIDWQKEEARRIIDSKLGSDECQALPTVFELNETFHMLFCYRYASDFRRNRERSYRIGHAYSVDLLNWTRDDEDMAIGVTEGAWDSDMLCYPHVFELDGQVMLLYNGNEFGRYGFGLAILE